MGATAAASIIHPSGGIGAALTKEIWTGFASTAARTSGPGKTAIGFDGRAVKQPAVTTPKQRTNRFIRATMPQNSAPTAATPGGLVEIYKRKK
ncbi:MAG TPA: hypothetical protein VNO55_17880 [Polyangia bacterium]|nr:hypothetical protein [Polyangia bacterium]